MFLDNKYTKWYWSIIKAAQSRQSPVDYTERHHIIPRALGGNDVNSNKVKLTAREHFVCHLLLTKMTTGLFQHKMLFALSMLTQIRNIGDGRYNPSSWLYEYARRGHVTAITEWWTPERRAQASIDRQGVNHHTPDSISRIREYQLNKQWSEKATAVRTANCVTNAAKRKGTQWSPARRLAADENPYQHTDATKQHLRALHSGKRLSSGRRVGYWFSQNESTPVLFCPLKHTANEHNISVHMLNRLMRGELDEHKGWKYVRQATKDEMQRTINTPNQNKTRE